MQYPKAGPASVAEYQVSGLPFARTISVVTSSVANLNFPLVTSTFFIKNNGPGYVAVGFTHNGVQDLNGQGNRFTIAPSGSFDCALRIKTLFFKATSANTTVEVVAGLTMVETNMFPVLTGSSAPGSFGSVTGSYEGSANTYGYSIGLG